jgi:segregation and condensation protein A
MAEGDFHDRLVSSYEHAVHLPIFEGPLDLLLFLIRRNEVDIYDIPIETVTRQYLDTIRAMESLNLEVAGAFFVMAAQLMYIKSRMLLPRDEQVVEAEEEDDSDLDPRWQLVQQLLEYRKFKEAAEDIRALIENHHDLIPRFARPDEEEPGERPLQPVDRIALWNTFNTVLRRLAERLVQGEIHDEQVTVSDRMEYLLERARTQPRFLFSSLFPDQSSLSMLVSTFLALLELSRLGQLSLSQHAAFADIEIEAVARPEPEEVPAG